VGYGDQLMATGMARGAKARGRRIAFGDSRRIVWDHNSAVIFKGNPNIAAPGEEKAPDLEWIKYYKGHRIYNRQDGDRWVWNLDFRPTPGEIFWTQEEKRRAGRFGRGFVLIEPHVETWKSVAPNKDWGRERYQAVADRLIRKGYKLAQFAYSRGGAPLAGVKSMATTSFRDALAVMTQARLYIGPEGGLHHGAAAVGIPAVVLFGGFIPPSVTGYPNHANLTGGAEACGRFTPCEHCRDALSAISVDEVSSAAIERL
jgi:ADP-heptose:LPS heptosyltransferase